MIKMAVNGTSSNRTTCNTKDNYVTNQIKQAVRLGGRHNMPPPRDFDF